MNSTDLVNAALKKMESDTCRTLFFGKSRKEKYIEFMEDINKLDLNSVKKVCSDMWENNQDELLAMEKTNEELRVLRNRTSEWIQKCARLESALKHQMKATRQLLRIKND